MQQKPIELDILTLIIAFSAFILSVINFYISRQQESKTRKDSVIKALQGEKESVAYVAYKIINDEWKKELKEGKFRDDVITSLCLSWALESSDRAKAIVFDALRKLSLGVYKEKVKKKIDFIQETFSNYATEFKPENFDKRLITVKNLQKYLENVQPTDAENKALKQ